MLASNVFRERRRLIIYNFFLRDDPSSLVKLGGYIQWIQGHNNSCQVAYPKCQDCGGIEMDKTFLYLRQGDDLVRKRKKRGKRW